MTQIGTTKERAAYRQALAEVNEATTFSAFCNALLVLMRTPRLAVYCERNGAAKWRPARDTRLYTIDFLGLYHTVIDSGTRYIDIKFKAGDIKPAMSTASMMRNEYTKCAQDGSLLHLCNGQMFMYAHSSNGRDYCRFVVED